MRRTLANALILISAIVLTGSAAVLAAHLRNKAGAPMREIDALLETARQPSALCSSSAAALERQPK